MDSRFLISPHHQRQYLDYYTSRTFVSKPSGWLPTIEALAAQFDCQTILDYGCGVNRGLSRFSKLAIADYDPGVEECAAMPQPADLVVCIHTLEHAEPRYVDAVLADLKLLARKVLFLVVCCEDSTKLLPDGSPWHSFVRDATWWQLRLPEFTPQPVRHTRPGAEYAAMLVK